jgi:excisionase family DNA binding protein
MYKAEINEIFRLLKMSINTSLKILTELKELQIAINTVYDGVEDRFTNKIKKYNKKNKIMTIKDVCKYSTLSMSTIRRAIKTKELKYTSGGGKYLFTKKSVDSWLRGRNARYK